MATEFDKIKNLVGWRSKLDELLEAAREVAKDEDLDARLAVADRLTQFIIQNPPAVADDPGTAEYDDMDRIARQAHDALLLNSIQERVAGIMSHTAELAMLRKRVEGRTAANHAAAASIRLEKARRLVDSTTATVAAMLDLKKDIERAAESGEEGADFAALAKQLQTLVERLQTLRSDVEAIR